MAARTRPTVRAAVPRARRRLPVSRSLVPSRRSLALGLGLAALAAGAYVAALATSVFAVRRLEIVGGPPRTQSQVRAALAPELGRSLLRIGAAEIDRRLAPVAGVLSVRTDRAFPHTLRVVIRPEHPVLILRRGSEGWLVSARGRVLRRLRNAHISSLPRTWVRGDATIAVGETLAPDEGGLAAAVLAPAAGSRLFGRVQTVRVGESELALRLRSGIEIRLGDVGDLRLKLAIARRILATLTGNDGVAYIDVSVPERPVVGSR